MVRYDVDASLPNRHANPVTDVDLEPSAAHRFASVERTDWRPEVRTCSPAHCCRHQAVAPRCAEYIPSTGRHMWLKSADKGVCQVCWQSLGKLWPWHCKLLQLLHSAAILRQTCKTSASLLIWYVNFVMVMTADWMKAVKFHHLTKFGLSSIAFMSWWTRQQCTCRFWVICLISCRHMAQQNVFVW